MKVRALVFIGFLVLSVVSCGTEKVNDDTIEGWSEISSNEMSYTDAFKYCEDLEENGTSNWRLPKISELRSLITGCEQTETDGKCNVTDDCVSFETPCDDGSSCRGCLIKPEGYSKLGDNVLLLSGSWFDYIADCDGCDYVPSETYSAGVDFQKAAVTFEYSGSVRCRKIMKGDKREISCTEKPLNSYWNWTSEITQEWDGNKWAPSNISTYNEELSQEECRFTCDNTYEWDEESGTCKSTIEYPWTDPDTELEWSSIKAFDKWEDIESFCDQMDEGGHTDWRVPDIDELRTLITNCPLTETGGECRITTPFLNEACISEECAGCYYSKSGIYSKLGDSCYLVSSSNNDVSEEFGQDTIFLYIDFLRGEIFSCMQPGYEWPVYSVFCRCVRG